ncbi:MAG: hypothetical protein KDD47_21285, partial [Acidobacteria bacterium]|nr:hypothetical protein [Acidobacteriota bacterium]
MTSRRRRRSRSNGFPAGLLWVLGGLAVLVFAGGYWLGGRKPTREPVAPAEKASPPAERGTAPKPTGPKAPDGGSAETAQERPYEVAEDLWVDGTGKGPHLESPPADHGPVPPGGGSGPARISLVID